MEETKSKKNVKKVASKDKKKTYLVRRIIAVVVLLLVVTLIVVLVVNIAPKAERSFVDAIVSNDYYIKMVELDEDFNEKGQVMTVTREGEDVVISTDEQTIMLKEEEFVQIYHKEKIITVFPRNSIANSINVGINGFQNNELKETREEVLNEKTYICKEYKNGIKVYYDGEEVKYFATKDGIAKIIDFEGMAKEELFEFPEGYAVAEQEEK